MLLSTIQYVPFHSNANTEPAGIAFAAIAVPATSLTCAAPVPFTFIVALAPLAMWKFANVRAPATRVADVIRVSASVKAVAVPAVAI